MAFLRLHGAALCRTEGHASPLLSKSASSRKRLKPSALLLKSQRKRSTEKMNASMIQLRADMKEISEEQKSIKEGQRQVRQKFEAIESQCQQLRNEAHLVMQQSATTRLRLTLMFQILKARQNNDFTAATQLARLLRGEPITENIKDQKQPKSGDNFRSIEDGNSKRDLLHI